MRTNNPVGTDIGRLGSVYLSSLRLRFHIMPALEKLVTSGLIVTTGAFVKKKPQIAEAIVAAINEAGSFIKANPRQAAEISLETEKTSRCLRQSVVRRRTDARRILQRNPSKINDPNR
jgi:hypothetical protein